MRVSPRRGLYQITARGVQLLADPPERIDVAFLEQYPEFQEFRTRGAATSDPALATILTQGTPASIDGAVLTPDEQVRVGAARFKESLAAQLLQKLKQVSPGFFERVVVDLLVAMGYGGSQEDAAKVVGRSGDGI